MYALPALTFESFTSRAANAAAVAAARGVAGGRADAPVLLVLHGPAGAGKTHLLSAIGAARRASDAAAGPLVEYVAMGDLLHRLRVTAAWGGGDAERHARADLLLVDDAQRAAESPAAAGALADLLLGGARAGRRVVLATSRAPAEIAAADPRLAALLAAATVCAVAPLVAARSAASPAARPVAAATTAAAGAAESLAAFADADETIGGPAGGQPPPSVPAPAARNDYASFLSDVVAAVTQHVEPWKQRLAEASARWGAEGYGVRVLDRALARATAPDVDGLLTTYAAAVAHLRRLEAEAVAVDPALAGAAAFRDPERVADAEAAVAALRERAPAVARPPAAGRPTPAMPREVATPASTRPAGGFDPFFLDPEKVILDWPDVAARAIEELR